MISVARAVKAHAPDLILGEGRGTLITLGLTCPLVLEATLALRNVDIKEALGIARMWGKVKGVIVRNPRIFKTRFTVSEIRSAVPEMFDSDHPWQHLKCFGIKDRNSPRHSAALELFTALGVPVLDKLGDVLARELLLAPGQLIWDHHGTCHCGRRTFLYSQCDKCARIEAIERQDEIMEKPSRKRSVRSWTPTSRL